MQWKPLRKRTVFISFSSDMRDEARTAETVLHELNGQLPEAERFEVFLWANIDGPWPGNSWQENIPRPSDPHAFLVICLFGERIGVPLPEYFPCPADLRDALPPWVKFPWPQDGDAEAVPLTGTLFELLDGLMGWRRGEESGPEVLIYIKADPGRFANPTLELDQHRYGFRHHYRRLAGDAGLIERAAERTDYEGQLKLFDRFCECFFRHGGHAYQCFGSGPPASADQCREMLRDLLQKDLPSRLGVRAQQGNRELKGLDHYKPEDWDILFGRYRQINNILNDLVKLDEASRSGTVLPVLTLIGKRGEGKSSVLQAGLIGQVRQGLHPTFGDLAVVVDGLGIDDPLTRLDEAIDRTLEGGLWSRRRPLAQPDRAERPANLVKAIANALEALPRDRWSQPRRLFVGLDQFEELLVAAEQSPGARVGLLELLETMRLFASERLGWVVLTMPIDYRERLEHFMRNELKAAGLPVWLPEWAELHAPDKGDIREIVTKSLVAAGLYRSSSERDRSVSQVTADARIDSSIPYLPDASSVAVRRSGADGSGLELIDSSAGAGPKAERASTGLEAAGAEAASGQARVPETVAAMPSVLRHSLVEQLVDEAVKWLSRQDEQSGPMLPLLSVLMDKLVRRRKEQVLTGSGSGDADSNVDTLEGVIDELGQQAWDQANIAADSNPDETLARLLRQLVITAKKRQEILKILIECRDDHQAVRRAGPLVTSLRQHRLMFYPQKEKLKLAHVSIVDHWGRAKSWFKKDLSNQRTFSRLEDRLDTAEETGGSPDLFTAPRELDAIEDLWLAWEDDDRLVRMAALMRDSLMRAIDLRAASRQWRRADGGSRLTSAMGIDDPTLVQHCFDQLREVDPEERRQIIGFPGADDPSLNGRGAMLHLAARCGNLETVRRLIDWGADVDQLNEAGQTPLWLAIGGGHKEVAAFLLQRGANIGHTDKSGKMLLQALWKRQELVPLLEGQEKVDVDCATADGNTSLMSVALLGDQAIAARLLDLGAKADLANSAGDTALVLAAQKGHAAIVRLLLDLPEGRRPDINVANKQGVSAVCAAVRGGHEELALELIMRGATLDGITAGGASLLHEAVNNMCLKVARVWLERKLGVDVRMSDGRTALYVATQVNKPDAVRLLLENGADVDARADIGYAPLHQAATGGDTDNLRLLIAAGANVDLQADSDDGRPSSDQTARYKGLTPAYVAVMNDRLAALELLLVNKANPELPSAGGVCPIHEAAHRGFVTIVKTLLGHGAQLAPRDGRNSTPIFFAAQMGRLDVVELLHERHSEIDPVNAIGQTPLHLAALGGHAAVVRYLCDNWANRRAKDENGSTVLHYAAKGGNEGVVALLLEREAAADAAAVDQWGQQPIHLAAQESGGESRDAIVRLLLDRGGSPTAKTAAGLTPLHSASLGGQNAIIALLLDLPEGERNGSPAADIDARTNDDRTALHVAAARGHAETVSLLLSRGIDADARTQLGQTALHYAGPHPSVIGHLLKAGSNADARSADGATPLHYAASNANAEGIDLLLASGADVNAQNAQGFTPLYYVVIAGHVPSTELLLRHGARVDLATADANRPIHEAAARGGAVMIEIMKLLVNRGETIDAVGSAGRTPLHMAAQKGFVEVIEFLLESGADPEAPSGSGSTALGTAAIEGRLAAVNKLFGAGAKVNAADKEGKTPLRQAVWKGHVDIVEALIESGADVELAANDGVTALHEAAYQGHEAILSLLMDHRADVERTDSGGNRALHFAVRGRRVATTRRLLERRAEADAPNNSGLTPLHEAAYQGDEAILALLIEHGADVKRTDNEGFNALHFAARGGKPAMAKKLIALGLAVDGTSLNGRTALQQAVWREHKDMVAVLLDCGADVGLGTDTGVTPLLEATYQGNEEILDLLIEGGADTNEADTSGARALQYAARNGKLAMVQKLVGLGMVVDATDDSGRAPLHDAAHGGHRDVIAYLLDHGADIERTNSEVMSPLQQAADRGRPEAAALLLQRGAAVDGISDGEPTALHQAAYKGYPDVVKILLDWNADVEARSPSGYTPLHAAAMGNRVPVIEMLLKRGACINALANDDRTPLHVAASNGHREAAACLIDAGADLTMVDSEGCRAWDIAAAQGREDIVQLLAARSEDR